MAERLTLTQQVPRSIRGAPAILHYQNQHIERRFSRSAEGQDYIAAMKLAGRYAYAGRDWVCDRVAKILGARILDSVHNHHNFAWRETHQGRDLWVVRKGATPAFPGQKGFVGGSMGTSL